MDAVKVKASEYANLIGVSLNTVKNRIRAGVLPGEKEEDGIWYVLLNREEYEFLTQKEEERSKQEANLSSNLEKLKAGFEGSLIATYLEMLMQKDRQREELFHELSSLYTLLAVKEKEIELLKKALEDREKERTLAEELRKELKDKEKEVHKLEGKLKEKELELAQKDIEIQKLLLEKEREMLSLRLELEQCKKQRETE
jgi:DNA repair exonuclease SbcCD ATPase subunit